MNETVCELVRYFCWSSFWELENCNRAITTPHGIISCAYFPATLLSIAGIECPRCCGITNIFLDNSPTLQRLSVMQLSKNHQSECTVLVASIHIFSRNLRLSVLKSHFLPEKNASFNQTF